MCAVIVELTRNDILYWADTLCSGEYSQGTGGLRDTITTDEKKERDIYCCLGVACDLFLDGFWEWKRGNWSIGGSVLMPPKELEYAINAALNPSLIPSKYKNQRNRNSPCDILSSLNDEVGMNFYKIASIIENSIRKDLKW